MRESKYSLFIMDYSICWMTSRLIFLHCFCGFRTLSTQGRRWRRYCSSSNNTIPKWLKWQGQLDPLKQSFHLNLGNANLNVARRVTRFCPQFAGEENTKKCWLSPWLYVSSLVLDISWNTGLAVVCSLILGTWIPGVLETDFFWFFSCRIRGAWQVCGGIRVRLQWVL